jgi:FkbM family methyltransferase
VPNVADVRAKLHNIARLIAAVEDPAPPVLDSLRLQRHPYTVRLRSGLSFSLQPRCGDWFTLLECAVRMDYFQHGIEIREGDTVVDVGANFGAFAIAASRKVGDSGRVFCYEPNPVVFERLQQNARMNGCRNITAFNEAVGGRSGEIELFVDRKSAFSTTHAEVDGRPASRSNSTKVPLRAIESALQLAGPSVTLLKIDCEGGEYDILEGLTPAAASPVSQVAMEVHRVPGRSVDSVPRLLAGLGFDVSMTSPLTAFRRTAGPPKA